MREETAQESRFKSIFKDTWGRFSSDNTAFLSWTAVLQLSFLMVTISCCIIGFVDPEKGTPIIASLFGGWGASAGIASGINTYSKVKYTKRQIEKGNKDNGTNTIELNTK